MIAPFNVQTESIPFRFEDVLILQTFDANGDITTYFRGVDSDIYPHFIGPGIIMFRHDYHSMHR